MKDASLLVTMRNKSVKLTDIFLLVPTKKKFGGQKKKNEKNLLNLLLAFKTC